MLAWCADGPLVDHKGPEWGVSSLSSVSFSPVFDQGSAGSDLLGLVFSSHMGHYVS